MIKIYATLDDLENIKPNPAGEDEALEDILEIGVFNVAGQNNIIFQDKDGKILIY